MWLLTVVFLGAGSGLEVSVFALVTGGFVVGGVALAAAAYLTLVALRGRRTYCFCLDGKGVTISTLSGRNERDVLVRAAELLSVWVRSPGQGQRSGDDQAQRVVWTEVNYFWVSARKPLVMLKRGRHTLADIRCTEENLEQVCRFLRDHVRPQEQGKSKDGLNKGLWQLIGRR